MPSHHLECVLCCAASHGKAGVTVNPTLADKNQQNTVPHTRLMEWVWSYFVKTDLYEGNGEASTAEEASNKAGAQHAEPSKQSKGATHWQHQEERSCKQQKTGDQNGSRAKGSSGEISGSPAISLTGTLL